MMELQTAPMVYSDALSKNLDLTKVEVNIPEFSEVLEEAVRGYAGKEQQARELLREYHHRYRNWQPQHDGLLDLAEAVEGNEESPLAAAGRP